MWLFLEKSPSWNFSSPVRIRVENWTFFPDGSPWASSFWLPQLNSSCPPLALWLEPFLPFIRCCSPSSVCLLMYWDPWRNWDREFLVSVEIRVVKMTFYASHRQLRHSHISISIMNETDWSHKVLSVADSLKAQSLRLPLNLWACSASVGLVCRRPNHLLDGAFKFKFSIGRNVHESFVPTLMTFSERPRVTWGFISASRPWDFI